MGPGAYDFCDYFPRELSVNDRLYVCYEKDTETLVVRWEGKVSSEEIRQGYKTIMELVRHYKPQKWLLDLHKRSTIKKKDQRWVFTQVFPEMLRIIDSNVFVAIVLPVYFYQSLVDGLEGDELMQGDNFMIIHHCLYQQEGRRWLQQMSLINAGA